MQQAEQAVANPGDDLDQASGSRSLIAIVGFSPVFGFFRELAEDLGPARGQQTFRLIRFVGEAVTRERLVFPELQDLNRHALQALNELYFAGPPDLPGSAHAKAPSHSRKTVLAAKGGR